MNAFFQKKQKMKISFRECFLIYCLSTFLISCSHQGHHHTSSKSHNDQVHQHHSGAGMAMTHSFKDAQKWAKSFDDPARDQWQKPEFVLKNLELQSKKCVVDIGAGTGYFSIRIAKALPPVGQVYAADNEPDMVTYLQQRSQREGLKNHTALLVTNQFPSLPEKCDLIFMVDTYHHIQDRTNYFKAGLNEMTINGKVAIIDFTMDSLIGPKKNHRISKAQVVQELSDAGYALEKDIAGLPNQYFLIFKRK